MKLFKKLIVALSVLLVVGMLAACSDGNSNSGGDNEGITGDYTLTYGTITMVENISLSYIQSSGLSSSDYTVSGKTINLTEAGFNKMFTVPDEDGETIVAIVIYNNKMVMPVTQDMIDYAVANLEEGVDYTVSADGRIITLTDDGIQAASTLFADYED